MTTTTIRVSEPRELLAYLPYRLGFRPRRSAVFVSLRGGRGRLGLVARVDLDDLADPDTGPSVAGGLATHLWRDGAERAVLVVYDDDLSGADSWRPDLVAAVGHAVPPIEEMVGPTQVWFVDGERYFAFDCPDARCCPPEGRLLGDLDSTAVSAQMVFAGASIAAHREAVTEVVPAPKQARYNVRRVARRWQERQPEPGAATSPAEWHLESLAAWHAVVRSLAQGGEVRARHLGRLAAGLRDRFVRDAVIMSVAVGAEEAERAIRLDRALASSRMEAAFGAIFDAEGGAPPDPTDRESWCAALRLVVAHAPRGEHSPALTLLALVSWWSGDGAAANSWLDRALAAEPGYRLAELLRETLDAAMPPGWARRAAALDARLR